MTSTQIDHIASIIAIALAALVVARRAWHAFQTFRSSTRSAACTCNVREWS
jgi:hypothetical protein